MAIKWYKPTSPGRRKSSVNTHDELTKGAKPAKSLLRPLKKTGGRNHHGVITSRFRGGGHKRRYRIIDFKRNKDGIVGTVDSIQYDPNRSSHIALIKYADGELRYILAPKGLLVGEKIESGEKVEPKVGNCMPLRSIPLGLEIHNVELVAGRGGQMARSAGAVCRLSNRDGGFATVIMPSGELRQVSEDCRATIGALGNEVHSSVRIGKAGRKRHMGRRPHNRGTSMNPVDHPLGGGEGHSHGGRHPVSPWGKPAKGGKTRKKNKASSKRIIRRRKSGRNVQLTL